MQKGERKARKALAKVGMKSLAGVTRVTIKKKDGIVFVINNPTVMRSGEDGNQFAVFGEITIDDPVNRVNMQKTQAMQAQAQAAAAAASAGTAKAEPAKATAGADDENVDAEGVSEEHIGMVIDHAHCTRAQAIKALKENNNDMVNAVMSLT